MQYDGTGLHGWAKQPGLPTVEGALEEAFSTVLGRVPDWKVAGRTDAGVHARRQVLSVRLPQGMNLAKLRRSLNALTPSGIAVMDIRLAPRGFDARKQATSRVYRYFLSIGPTASPFWRPYCWHVPYELHWEAMEAAAAAVVGRHDFTGFTPADTEHVHFTRRVLVCRWRPLRGEHFGLLRLRMQDGAQDQKMGVPGLCYLEIEADAFLRHMVRTLVGTMVEVGKGARDLEDFTRLLKGASRGQAGPTAPAQGLFLWDVKYGRKRGAVPEDDLA